MQGITLIEVLISLLILSFVLLGFDALEMQSYHKMREAYYFSVAMEQLYSMAERLRVHSNDQQENQLQIWNSENQLLLPAGQGIIQQHDRFNRITLFWGKKTNKKICKEPLSKELHCLTVQQISST